MRNSGVTLIELLVVITIAGILAVALGASFQGWQSAYRVETEIKKLYNDLMDARINSRQKKREHYIVLASDEYTVYEDDDPEPDGDGNFDPASDYEVLNEKLSYNREIDWNGGAQIDFTTRGLTNDNKTICIFSEYEPDYDCIVIFVTRTKMGKIDDQGGLCEASNCELK
jgi:prepilin-type N-terminal cleavage/methylation domain-containing protein